MTRDTRFMMGMPITVVLADARATIADVDAVYQYFKEIDERFSTYKPESEISAINFHGLPEAEWSIDMKEVFRLSEETKKLSGGYFDIKTKSGTYDPSGLVKGWAVRNAGKLLRTRGLENFYVDAGGDIEVAGLNGERKKWRIGIRNPFANPDRNDEIVKVFAVTDAGIATSGTYIRGQHIYNPHDAGAPITDIVSLTVIGPNVYEADRFATAAFAMGRSGIEFIEKREHLEGYMIDKDGIATETSGLGKYEVFVE